MISKALLYIGLIPLNAAWFWAYTGFTNSLPDHKRVKRLLSLMNFGPRNGPKQIMMLQIASAFWRLGKDADALEWFSRAKQSEENWGGRKNGRVSEYLIAYSEFFLDVGSRRTIDGLSESQKSQLKRLERIKVPDSIRDYKLPLPFLA